MCAIGKSYIPIPRDSGFQTALQMTEVQTINTERKTEPRLADETRHYSAHSQEAAEALRSLAKIHQDLTKEHAAKAIK